MFQTKQSEINCHAQSRRTTMSILQPEYSPMDVSSEGSLSGLDLDSSGSTTHRPSTSNSDLNSPSGEAANGLASKETSRIKNLRSVLITVPIVNATGTSAGLLFFTRSSERKESEAAFLRSWFEAYQWLSAGFATKSPSTSFAFVKIDGIRFGYKRFLAFRYCFSSVRAV